MKKSTLLIFGAIGAIVLGIVILYLYGAGVRDSAVEKQESVNAAWGNVQSAYQRRADLIGNLVETVRAAAENEKEILVGVTEARAGIKHYADSVGNIINQQSERIKRATSPDDLQSSDMVMMTAYGGFRGFITENYPTVQSTQNFSALQSELEGTENRINTERNRYNDSVKDYNSHIRGTFKRMGLKLVSDESDDFTVRKAFEAKPGADEAPKVKF